MRTRWLILEPSVAGHHATYLEKIVEGAVENHIEVVVGSSAALSTSEFCGALQERFGAQQVSVLLEPLPADCHAYGSPRADIRRELAYWRFFRRIYCQATAGGRVTAVFLPYLDHCANAVGLLGSPFAQTPLYGICMRPTFHFRRMGVAAPRRRSEFIRRMLFERMLGMSSVRRLFTIDETLYRYFRDRCLPNSGKLVFLPDPAEFTGAHSRTSARAELGIPAEATVILLYGSLEGRKGVRSLLDRIADPGTDSNTHLLVVGRQSQEVSDMLAESRYTEFFQQGRIHEVNRYVSPEEEQIVFAAADVAWLKYEGFYQMSGVLVKAVQAGLRLELPDAGLLGWYKKAQEGGRTLNFEDNNWTTAKRLLFMLPRDHANANDTPDSKLDS
jgi:hypothetical protein